MQYIVMDLEWNNVYSSKRGMFFNEIIEIGAVKLDENFREISRFSQTVNTALGNRLRRKVKELTHITNEEINNGFGFTRVMSDYRHWIGNVPSVVMTWGNTDVYVMLENFKYFSGAEMIPFMHYYADLQKYCQSVLKTGNELQLGLSSAAEMLDIPTENIELHRALGDALLTADCLRKTYIKEKLEKYISSCDGEFYERLYFKPYVIRDLNSAAVDRKKFNTFCPDCGSKMRRVSKWSFKNAFFRAKFNCNICGKKYKVSLRYKQYYDYVDFKKKVEELVEKKDKE